MSYFTEPGEAFSRQLGLVGIVICASLFIWVVSLALRRKDTGIPDPFHWVIATTMTCAAILASWGNLMDNDLAFFAGAGLGVLTFLAIWVRARIHRR